MIFYASFYWLWDFLLENLVCEDEYIVVKKSLVIFLGFLKMIRLLVILFGTVFGHFSKGVFLTFSSLPNHGDRHMYYKLEQACVTNWGIFVLLQIRANIVTNWGSFIITTWGKCFYNWGNYYKLGQPLLQNRVTITN